MPSRISQLLIVILLVTYAGCTAPQPSSPTVHSQSVWAVDFIRFLPDGQTLYEKNIRENWAQAREIALENGDILAFHALAAEPDTSLAWDIMLMTEYADSSRWANREEIFDSPDYQHVQIDVPSSELREFVYSGVHLSPIVSGQRP